MTVKMISKWYDSFIDSSLQPYFKCMFTFSFSSLTSCTSLSRLLIICSALVCKPPIRTSISSTPSLVSAFRAFHLERALPSSNTNRGALWGISISIYLSIYLYIYIRQQTISTSKSLFLNAIPLFSCCDSWLPLQFTLCADYLPSKKQIIILFCQCSLTGSQIITAS